MTNKTTAIFGIATYLLSVYSSATNADGQSTVPDYIIVISGIATVLFTILATVRLWKISKFISLLFVVTSGIFFFLEVMQVTLSPSYGSPLILTLNITKVVSLLTFFYAIFLLWRTPTQFNRKTI